MASPLPVLLTRLASLITGGRNGQEQRSWHSPTLYWLAQPPKSRALIVIEGVCTRAQPSPMLMSSGNLNLQKKKGRKNEELLWYWNQFIIRNAKDSQNYSKFINSYSIILNATWKKLQTYQEPAVKIVLSIQSCFPEHESTELQTCWFGLVNPIHLSVSPFDFWIYRQSKAALFCY